MGKTSHQAPNLIAKPIERDGLLLSPLQRDDADAMSFVLQDQELYVSIGGEPPSIDELRRKYERQAIGASPDGSQLWLNWIIRVGGDPGGYVQATVVPQAGKMVAEIAWVIGVRWQGRGLATQSARLMRDWLKDNGVGRFTASIHPHHAPSGAVATRLGMRQTNLTSGDGEIIWEMPYKSQST